VYGEAPETVSLVCAKEPVAITGKLTEAGPDVASVTTARALNAFAQIAADGLY
jgi:hypothetical protein